MQFTRYNKDETVFNKFFNFQKTNNIKHTIQQFNIISQFSLRPSIQNLQNAKWTYVCVYVFREQRSGMTKII